MGSYKIEQSPGTIVCIQDLVVAMINLRLNVMRQNLNLIMTLVNLTP